jgi:hypothetical protein
LMCKPVLLVVHRHRAEEAAEGVGDVLWQVVQHHHRLLFGGSHRGSGAGSKLTKDGGVEGREVKEGDIRMRGEEDGGIFEKHTPQPKKEVEEVFEGVIARVQVKGRS